VTQAVAINVSFVAKVPPYNLGTPQDALLQDEYDVLLAGAKWQARKSLDAAAAKIESAMMDFLKALNDLKNAYLEQRIRHADINMGNLP